MMSNFNAVSFSPEKVLSDEDFSLLLDIISKLRPFDEIEREIIFNVKTHIKPKFWKYLIPPGYNRFSDTHKIITLIWIANYLAKALTKEFYFLKNQLLIYLLVSDVSELRDIGLAYDDLGNAIIYIEPYTGPQFSFHVFDEDIIYFYKKLFPPYKKAWIGRRHQRQPVKKPSYQKYLFTGRIK